MKTKAKKRFNLLILMILFFLSPLTADDNEKKIAVLAPGEYQGPITIQENESLFAEGAIIRGSESQPAVILMNGASIQSALIFGMDSSPLGAAILVKGTGTEIKDCEIYGGPSDGVVVLRGSVRIQGTRIKDSRYGIHARESTVELDWSVVSKSRKSALTIQEISKLMATNVRVENNSSHGIVLGVASSASIINSSITNNRGFGVLSLFPSSSVSIASTFVTDNANGNFRDASKNVYSALPTAWIGSTDTAVQSASTERIENEPKPSENPFIKTSLKSMLNKNDFALKDLAIPHLKLDTALQIIFDGLDSPVETAFKIETVSKELANESSLIEVLSKMYTLASGSPPRTFEQIDTDLIIAMDLANWFLKSQPDQQDVYRSLVQEDQQLTLLEDHIMGPKVRARTKVLGQKAHAHPLGELVPLTIKFVKLASLIEARFFDPTSERYTIDENIFRELDLKGDILHLQNSEAGIFVIGGTGPNVYPSGLAFILDLGGDDVYQDAAASDSNVAIVVDLAGNDIYNGRTCSSRNGISLLIDHQGNDRYLESKNSLASTYGGAAILWDKEGDDIYHSLSSSQAFAVSGLALLFDADGHDLYRATNHAQGMSGPNGIALLLDARGDDIYQLLSGSKDDLRNGARAISFGQGFSTGLRPGSAGGIGMLLDGQGDDNYTAGLFAQGTGYWASLGVLADVSGNDIYNGWQYVQGTGVHIALGYLLDLGPGDDGFFSWSVSQGCGHDQALGYLYNENGSDLYQAYSRAQGMGLSNGIGIFVDAYGDDRYLINKPDEGQGHAWFEPSMRRYGSVGLFLDMTGADLYTGNGSDVSEWTQGKIGIGWDK